MIYRGIDWAEKHHDVVLVGEAGQLLAKRRITDDAASYQILPDLLAEYDDSQDEPIPIAIETNRGLLVSLLGPARLSRGNGPLPPPPQRTRRLARLRPAQRPQQPDRPAPPLPPAARTLRRRDGLLNPVEQAQQAA